MSDVGNYAGTVAKDAALGSVVPGVGTAIGAGLGLVEGGIQLFSSLAKEKKDKAALRNIHDPFYKIQDEFLQNRNDALIRASGGTPQSELDATTGAYKQGLGASISGVLQGGGNVNDIGKLFDVYNKSIDKTYGESAEQHLKNQDYFAKVNTDYAGEKIKQWALSQYQPTQEKKKQLSENIATDTANAYAGANTAIGSFSAGTTGNQNNRLLDMLFRNRSINTGVQKTGNPVSYSQLPDGYSMYTDPNTGLSSNYTGDTREQDNLHLH